MTKIEALLYASPALALFALVGATAVAVLRRVRQMDDALDCWDSDDWDESEFDMAPTMSADYLKAYDKPYAHTGEAR